MNTIIETSLSKAVTYQAYRVLVSHLAEMGKTTGGHSESNINYTKLNDRRMKRWDKTLKIPKDIERSVQQYSKDTTWLVITESWCGDAAYIIPVLNKLVALNDHIKLKLVLRDENPELMDAYLTNGNRSIPKVIMVDDDSGDVLNVYGPRPSVATDFVNRFKNLHGKLTSEFKEDLQYWYNNDKGLTTLTDMTEMLCKIESSVCQ